MIREKEALETGRLTPAGVTEVSFDARGKRIVTEHDPVAWQRGQAAVRTRKVAAARRKLEHFQKNCSREVGRFLRNRREFER